MSYHEGSQAGSPDALRSKSELIRVLRRAGIAPETIDALERELEDPVDLNRDGHLLAAHGITRDRLMERFGGSV